MGRVEPAAGGGRPPALDAETDGTLLAAAAAASAVLLAAEAALSQSVPMTLAALRIGGIIAVAAGGAAFARVRGVSFEGAALLLILFAALVCWWPSPWWLLPPSVGTLAALRSIGLRRLLATLASARLWMAVCLAAVVILPVRHYGDFLILDKLPQSEVPQDTVFHASVAAMIKTYGVVSTGLHGLVPIDYHVLSHRLVAGLSSLSGVPVLEVYGIVPIVFLGPWLLFCCAWAAGRIGGSAAEPLRAWMAVCALLLVLALLPLERWAVWDSYFVSESYTLALGLLVLALPALASERPGAVPLAAAAVFIVAAGASKGSVGVLGLALLWVRALDWAIKGDRRAVVAALAASIAFTLVMGRAAQTALATWISFKPFAYAQVHSVGRESIRDAVETLMRGQSPALPVLGVAAAALAGYLAANFLVSWAVIIRRWAIDGVRGLTAPDAGFSVIAVAIAGGTLLFAISGGNYYFVNPAMFVSLPFLAAAAAGAVRSRRAELAAVGMLLAALSLAWGLGTQDRSGWDEKRAAVLARNQQLYPPSRHVMALLAIRGRALPSSSVLQRGGHFLQPEKGYGHCAMWPFLYPAITEHAWIGVIEAESKCPYENYGFGFYFQPASRHLLAPAVPPGAPVVVID